MEIINKNGMEFIKFKDGDINILFSTAENNVSYKISESETLKNFEALKNIFDVKKVNYTSQVHGDKIINLDDETSEDKEADGLILSRKNEIAGVFTADCVPVILYDVDKKIISAVHSGWKGTIADISKKAVLIMRERYKCENIKAIIGPCVGECCYEVSEQLAKNFTDKYGRHAANGRMLNLVAVIKNELSIILGKENVKSLDICTNCTTDYKMHSYRNNKEEAGRLFSFVYVE